MRYETRPLGPWLGPVTDDRASARRFKAPWRSTLDLLAKETDYLGAPLIVVQVDVAETDVRRDGMVRAHVRPGFPGVRISFGSHYGPLTYATDTFDDWQANVRAIALGLEALRTVDRYGISKTGEQYVGWRAITNSNAESMTVEQAALYLADAAGLPVDLPVNPEQVKRAFLKAAKDMHPDRGGDGERFRRLTEARTLLLGGGA